MEDRLRNIFGNVSDWLKFAEAKNAVLITLNGTAIFSFLQLFGSKLLGNSNIFVKTLGWEFVILNAISMVLALLSFLPQTKEDWFWSPKGEKPANENCIYFGYIQAYSQSDYINLLENKFNSKLEPIERDYATQIVTNSRIAYRKMQYFKLALFFTLSSVITILLGGFVYYIMNPNEGK